MRTASHQDRVSRRFSAAAESYDAESKLQAEVARKVIELVPDQASKRHILDAGCGTGELMARARKRWPTSQIHGIDLAPGMVSRAQDRFSSDPFISVELADAATYRGGPFDLIVSSSALHWLRPFKSGLCNLLSSLRADGFMVAALMTRPTFSELHIARHAVAPRKSAPDHLPLINEIGQALVGNTIHLLEEVRSSESYTGARHLLRSLHQLGVTAGDLSHADHALTRRELETLIRYYDEHFGDNMGGVTASFGVAYMVVQKA